MNDLQEPTGIDCEDLVNRLMQRLRLRTAPLAIQLFETIE